MRLCTAARCSRPTSSEFSAHCALHKARVRRHGDPEQEGVTKTQLKPYAAIVRERIAGNADNPAWSKLEARWGTVVSHAEGIIAARQAGRAGISWEITAAYEVLRLAPLVTPREVLETVAAMVLMRETEGRRFRSDRAFRAQLVRRVRGLTEANATEYRDFVSGKVRRTYSELSPRAAAVMAEWLIEALGIGGHYIARKELEEREAKAKARIDLLADLEGLK